MKYRAEIDGLRAIAVAAVVLYHAAALPAAGFVGVDIFFVISGYLITGLLLQEHAASGRIDVLAFYARRARRILPAVIAVELAALAAASMLLPPEELVRTAQSATASALFGANFFFEALTGYFSPRAEQMPLLHLWSLSVEEQFYLFWPALLLVLLRLRARRVGGAIALAGALSFALAEWLVRTHPDAAFFQMPARFWELAAGGFVATTRAGVVLPRWLPALALLGIVAACCMPAPYFPGAGALLAVAATATLLWCVHGGGDLGLPGALLRSPPMVGIGLVSYSLYLVHWPLLAFYRATTVGNGEVGTRLALCLGAVVLAFLSYRYIEQPLRRQRAPRARVVVGGAAASLLLAAAAAAYAYAVAADEAARPRDNPLAIKAESDLPTGWHRCHYQVWDTQFPKCEYPAARTALWGDSMAMSWWPAFENAAKFTRDACGPFVGYVARDPRPAQAHCRDWNAQVAIAVRSMDTVVLAARWADHFTPARAAELESGLRATLAALHDVTQVLIVMPTPELRDDVPHCIRRNERCDISRAQFEAQSADARARLQAVAGEFPNVRLIDATDYLCTADVCPGVKDGVALYTDSHHISATAARAVTWHVVGDGRGGR